MCDALVRHGSEYTIVQWTGGTLEGRMVVATLNRTSVRLAIARGCPPGVGGGVGWYLPGSVEVVYLFKDMQMTYVFWQ